MNIFITGSNVSVGSRLMWYLEEEGHAVFDINKRDYCLIEKHPKTILGVVRQRKTLDQDCR